MYFFRGVCWLSCCRAVLVLMTVTSHCARAFESTTLRQPYTEAKLISDSRRVVPGGEFYVGLNLKLADHWHVYWKNPGDSGMAPRIDWQLPPGVLAAEILWPRPEKISVPPLMNYGYSDNVTLPVAITLAENYRGDSVKLLAAASWLVCKEVCIPGEGELQLELPVGSNQASLLKPDIDRARASVPRPLKLLSGTLSETETDVNLEIYAANKAFSEAKTVDFFFESGNVVNYAAEGKVRWKNNYIHAAYPKAETFHMLPQQVRGILVIDQAYAWEFSVSP